MLKKIYLIILGVLIAFILSELISLMYVSVVNRTFFYDMPMNGEAIVDGDNSGVTPIFKIHPYLGFVFKDEISVGKIVLPDRIKYMTGSLDPLPRWVALLPNNHGFWSDVEYPYVADPDTYIIGVFGGSVAQWLAIQGGEYLREQVSKIPGLRGKQIKILNLAIGGYKQPQQILALAYMLSLGQRFDLILNVDGFNEVALTYAENIPKNIHYSLPRSYPSSVSALSSLADEKTIAWLYKGKNLKSSIRRWESLTNQRLSAVVYLVASRLSLIYKRLLQDHAGKMPPMSEKEANAFFRLGGGYKNSNKNDPYGFIGLWEKTSLLMRCMAEESGAKYIHVLQPNQYYSRKKMTDEERLIAYDEDHPYADAVRKFYPVLIEKSKVLTAKGVNFVDATSIFDDVRDVIYSDTCCHYNDLGNQILANEIVTTMKGLTLSHD